MILFGRGIMIDCYNRDGIILGKLWPYTASNSEERISGLSGYGGKYTFDKFSYVNCGEIRDKE